SSCKDLLHKETKRAWELGHEHKFVTEIVARRANECIVSITEPDYKNLNKNDIEDMYLLIMNGKVADYAKTRLLWSLSVFIRSLVIWERVHDFQLEIESYQQKVNLTAPTISFLGVEKHKMFSIIYEPMHGIIYKNSKKEKRVMRHSEIHKFCDATLNRVLEGLKSYNNDVKYGYVQRELTNDEVEYLKLFEEEIKVRLKYRNQMRRWEISNCIHSLILSLGLRNWSSNAYMSSRRTCFVVKLRRLLTTLDIGTFARAKAMGGQYTTNMSCVSAAKTLYGSAAANAVAAVYTFPILECPVLNTTYPFIIHVMVVLMVMASEMIYLRWYKIWSLHLSDFQSISTGASGLGRTFFEAFTRFGGDSSVSLAIPLPLSALGVMDDESPALVIGMANSEDYEDDSLNGNGLNDLMYLDEYFKLFRLNFFSGHWLLLPLGLRGRFIPYHQLPFRHLFKTCHKWTLMDDICRVLPPTCELTLVGVTLITTTAPNTGFVPIIVHESPTTDNSAPIRSGHTSYAKLVTSELSSKNVKFCTSIAPVGNEVDVAIQLESIRAISERFHGVPMKEFSEDADEELKDTIVVAMPKLVGEGFNMCTIHVEYEWKPPRKHLLVDDDEKPLPKVISIVNVDSDSEVEEVFDEHTTFMALTSIKRGRDSGYDTNSLSEQ
ncbi:hypothetical protein Tco_1008819, partial [Tanacetum coccineum]